MHINLSAIVFSLLIPELDRFWIELVKAIIVIFKIDVLKINSLLTFIFIYRVNAGILRDKSMEDKLLIKSLIDKFRQCYL